MSKISSMGTVDFHADAYNSYDGDDSDDELYDVNVSDDPNIIENFTEVEKIGGGSYGLIFKAKKLKDNEPYALKYVRMKTPNNIENREVEALKSLDNVNVIKYYDHWTANLSINTINSSTEEESNKNKYATNGSTTKSKRTGSKKLDPNYKYLVIQTELCQQNLRKLIDFRKEFEMNDNKWEKLISDMISGLIHVHNTGIIHRDIKPENILIGMDNRAKIADFGLARTYKTSYPEGYITSRSDNLTPDIGTMPYVAPEILGSKSVKYSKKADHYSIGIILSEIYVEMGVSKRARVMDRLRVQDFKDLNGISDEGLTIITSLLSHQPEMRMELEDVLNKLQLKHQQSVEKIKVGATRGSFCETENPGHSRNLYPKIQSPVGTEPYTVSTEEEDPDDPSQLEENGRALTLYK